MRRFSLILLALLPAVASGQSLRPSSGRTLPPRVSAAIPHDSILARGLVFRGIGPSLMGGRITEIAVGERGGRLGAVIYIAAATGGLWRSTNAGVSWTSLFDSVRAPSLGAIAVAPSNP